MATKTFLYSQPRGGYFNFFENIGTAFNYEYELIDQRYLSINVGGNSYPVLVDIDGDGDLDLFIGDNGYSLGTSIHYYQNVGTANNPHWQFITDNYNQIQAWTFSFIDIDADGDQGLVCKR